MTSPEIIKLLTKIMRMFGEQKRYYTGNSLKYVEEINHTFHVETGITRSLFILPEPENVEVILRRQGYQLLVKVRGKHTYLESVFNYYLNSWDHRGEPMKKILTKVILESEW